MMANSEYEYLRLMADILKDGQTKPSRGAYDLKAVFGRQLHFDLREGFPLLTTKKMPFKILINELLWFISGSSKIDYLHEHNIHYWDDFAAGRDDLGRIYGVQWRHWRRPDGTEVDQLAWAIDQIRSNPHSKAIIVNAWNAGELDDMRLPPCHTMFQFDVTNNKLRLQLYQRSSDVFLGLPFNIAQYAALLHIVANLTKLEPRELIISIGSAHLYKNHLEQAKEQVRRKPYKFPELKINGSSHTIDDFTINNFELLRYLSHPHIKADLVVL